MDYLLFMIAIFATLANLGLVMIVIWLINELLPDVIRKWRNR